MNTNSLQITGPCTLQGSVRISGSNGAGLAMLAAAVLATPGADIALYGLPATASIQRQLEFLGLIGCTVRRAAPAWHISPPLANPDTSCLFSLPWDTLLLMGPLIYRWGSLAWPLPESGRTGPRPLDQHIKALRVLGAKVSIASGRLHIVADKLAGTEIVLDIPSFGATWTAVTAALRAEGVSHVIGSSRSPEILDAINLLNKMGARISGAGTEVITVHGGATLGGAVHDVIPDRIAAGFYLLAGTATGGNVEVTGVIGDHLRTLCAKLTEMGAIVALSSERVAVRVTGKLQPITLRTGFYPGFPSQLQPALCSALLAANGASIVTEKLYDDRLFHLDELMRLGGKVDRDGQLAIINGGAPLGGARLEAAEPGCAAALVIAALMAEGVSYIDNANLLTEWLEKPVANLQTLGACSKWRQSDPTAV